jgi:hypothetical protein
MGYALQDRWQVQTRLEKFIRYMCLLHVPGGNSFAYGYKFKFSSTSETFVLRKDIQGLNIVMSMCNTYSIRIHSIMPLNLNR